MGRRTSGRTTRDRAPARFVLWREVLVAYASPALTAGAGGLATGRHDLTVAAFTSIAGTSAAVAALTGARLRRTGGRPRRAASLPKAVRAAGAGLVAAALAAGVALLAVRGLPVWPGPPGGPWPGRLGLDLPLSAALAATLITWRHSGTGPGTDTGPGISPGTHPTEGTTA
ncbi:hypothetical protein [Streptomyces sp. NPDC051567]|uniref:hypothetical protein n=1 Tax=Streptomyces sp. NPDC051567 TaxID=3365660 RepID=UPI0037BC7845